MAEELLHCLCCFECNSLFAIGCVKGCSKHVSSVVAAARHCNLTPCRFHPFSKHPNHYTQNDYRTELYYFPIIVGDFCSVIAEPNCSRNCFWPQGSTGVQKYGCIPRSAANNLGEIPQNMGAPNPLFLRVFLGRAHFGIRPFHPPSLSGMRLHFVRPHFPSPNAWSL